jgi:hypothetical protein
VASGPRLSVGVGPKARAPNEHPENVLIDPGSRGVGGYRPAVPHTEAPCDVRVARFGAGLNAQEAAGSGRLHWFRNGLSVEAEGRISLQGEVKCEFTSSVPDLLW